MHNNVLLMQNKFLKRNSGYNLKDAFFGRYFSNLGFNAKFD